MPFIGIRTDVRDRMVELARDYLSNPEDGYKMGFYHGFMDTLNFFLKSEQIGMMVMDKDCILEGEEPFTDCLPRLVVTKKEEK